MQELSDNIMIALMLINVVLLASSRLRVCIAGVAVQGALTGILPLVTHHALALDAMIFACVTVVLKGWVFPHLLKHALREANVEREISPLVGYPLSVMMSVAIAIAAFWVSARLPLPQPVASPLEVPIAVATILSGLFIIVSRIKALTQVLGYLVFENGIYLFGVALLMEQPLFVELGILLDIFVAVFVMGIAMFHINREFDHIDTHELDELADWKSTNV